jgi:hypothetical protein
MVPAPKMADEVCALIIFWRKGTKPILQATVTRVPNIALPFRSTETAPICVTRGLTIASVGDARSKLSARGGADRVAEDSHGRSEAGA